MNPFRPRRQGRVIILSDSILKYADFGGHGFLKAIRGANIQTFIDLLNQGWIQDWARIGAVLIHVGTNDINNGESEQVKPRLEILVNLIHARNIHTGVIISGILPRPVDYEDTKKIVGDVNSELQTWAANTLGVHFYQSFRPFLYRRMGKKQKVQVKANLFSNRCRLHLNREGLAILVVLLKNQIQLFRRGDILRTQ